MTQRKKIRSTRFFEYILQMPGVNKVFLSDLQQKLIGCVPGEDITTENPWLFIKKDILLDNLFVNEQSTELAKFDNEINNYPQDELLFGYTITGENNMGELFIFTSEESTKRILQIIEKKKVKLEQKLEKAIVKSVKNWPGLGADREIDENIIKNFRPLLEVQVESKYPIILPQKVYFKMMKVDSFRDGYMEMKSSPDFYNNFIRHKTIDAYVQVSNTSSDTETQTICKYPTNIATEYSYTYDKLKDLPKEKQSCITKYIDKISDMLEVNLNINFYTDDYSPLQFQDPMLNVQFDKKQFVTFLDVNYCKQKMVGAICCHPTYQDITAISYVAQNKRINNFGLPKKNSDREIAESVVPVLIWSTSNTLAPVLMLECHREVLCLDFCPQQENLIIGGCKNGQIILWDLQDKLRVQNEKKFSSTTRMILENLMSWMKNTYEEKSIRSTAISDLQYSHKGPVVSIFWSTQFYEVSKTGKLSDISTEEKKASLQFISASEDGTILIWDLLQLPLIEPGGFRAIRKLRRLDRRPSALIASTSPFRIFHLNLKPQYKINIKTSDKKLVPLSCAAYNYQMFEIKDYRIVGKGGRETMINVLEFKKPAIKIGAVIKFGNLFGEYMRMKWSGHDFDTGETVHSENAEYITFSGIHDGPIASISFNDHLNLTLTAGGSILAVWSTEFQKGPLFWRKGPFQYTCASWHIKHHYNISASRVDGRTETWTLYVQTKSYSNITTTSSYEITDFQTPLDAKITTKVKPLVGFGDTHGIFRYFTVPRLFKSTERNFGEIVNLLACREKARKQQFIEWQEKWNAKHPKAPKLQEKNQKPLHQTILTRKSVVIPYSQCDTKLRWNDEQMNYFDFFKLKCKHDQQQRLRKGIIEKHQINVKDMEKQRKPLERIAYENELKWQRKKSVTRNAEAHFNDAVKIQFPDVCDEHPITFAEKEKADLFTNKKRRIYEMYQKICVDAQNFIDTHKFNKELSFKDILENSKRREHGRHFLIGSLH